MVIHFFVYDVYFYFMRFNIREKKGSTVAGSVIYCSLINSRRVSGIVLPSSGVQVLVIRFVVCFLKSLLCNTVLFDLNSRKIWYYPICK